MRLSSFKAAGGTVARYRGTVWPIPAIPPPARIMRSVRSEQDWNWRSAWKGGAEDRKSCMRVGMATGVVFVGDLLRSHVADSPPVIGETATFAARLQELAKPNSVVICDTTHRLAGALFDYAISACSARGPANRCRPGK